MNLYVEQRRSLVYLGAHASLFVVMTDESINMCISKNQP
jgi:hypothetical protein